jgi:ribosomal protein S27E
MTADAYYQPPEPRGEREIEAHCDDCEADTFHVEVAWSRHRIERTCQECGRETEIDE